MQETSVIKLLLQYADNALILGHRLSEWCGHGPILEQDIALTNMSLDHIGQCRYLYDLAAAGLNRLSPTDKSSFFLSTTLKEKCIQGKDLDQDDLAYLRDSWEFRNILLVEQPNTDWAYTVVRSYFYDTFMCLLYRELAQAQDEEVAAVAEKSLKEAIYHKKWSGDWFIRLGDGTEESHQRIQEAVDDLWSYTGEMFTISEDEESAYQTLGVNTPKTFYNEWLSEIQMTLNRAILNDVDTEKWMHQGGKTGQHTEHLGYILTQLQYMQRAYPDMKW